MTEDDRRDIAIAIVDALVQKGHVPDCIDTDDMTEFEVQDMIVEILEKIHRKTPSLRRLKMEELLEQVDNTTKWHGFDVSIEHALEYGFLWTTGHKDTDELYVFMRYGENRWNGCWFSEDPHELIRYYDFIDWDEYGDQISSNKWYLTLEQVLLRLQSCNPLDVMGEAYSGYLSTEQVLQQILEAK